jgi:GTP-binding protein Era
VSARQRPTPKGARDGEAPPARADAAGDAASPKKASIVALAGAPNVGKSTLLNRILGRPLSIATPKPQTTRARVLGVHVFGSTQLAFTDTPGIHEARGPLHERMVGAARAGVQGADQTCWIVSAEHGIGPVDRTELPRLAGRSVTVVVNKIDLAPRERVLPIIAAGAQLAPDAEFFPVSALTGENIDVLLAHLAARATAGEWLYAPDDTTDRPVRFFVAELIREQLFRQLSQELPYHVAVKVDVFEERKPKTYVEATIYTDRDSAKKIIVGREGARIKTIGRSARKAIEAFLECEVYLQLFVRVKKDWQSDPRFLEEIGL